MCERETNVGEESLAVWGISREMVEATTQLH